MGVSVREFTPASSDTLPVQRTTFQYDGLGRQRAVIQHGSEPSFTATDYFLPGADGADGWNVIRFVPLPGTDLSTYSDPNIKDWATRTRADSLGNVYFIQQPDPSSNPNDTPTTLVTYSYLPELYATAVTTRLSAAENVGTGLPAIDLDNAGTRVTRQVTDANGNLILDAQRFSGFANSDALTVGTPDADGYSHFIDAEATKRDRSDFDAIGPVRLREAANVPGTTDYVSRCVKSGTDGRSFSGSGLDIIGSLFASSPAWIRHDDTRH